MPRKKGSKSSSKTKKIGGITFSKVSCHKKKTDASKAAKNLRAKGYTARVIGGCVFKGRKSKTKKRK
ncbi:MAG: hypothetical protein KDC34_19075 [Saprospiraceae bacterium]|nr:hypothetical protein [Saprospiraceae bacterium]